ncbi:MAG TPA: ACT domain-containing protein [Candidatus Limnocylindria bacterium]|jgi:hypothetical protein
MPTEFTIKLKDRPGTLAALTSALGAAGVNIRGIGGTKGVVGLVVGDKDTAKARRTLKKAKYRATERGIVEVRLADKPGSLSAAAKRFAKGRVNIASAYVIAPGRGKVTVAFGVKNARAAKKALGR